MLRQNALLRRHALGNFERLTLDVTKDPAMLLWLNGTSNNVWNPNENYARELQELFCLGAGNGYTERDVRELARALTGFANDWTDSGPKRFRFEKKLHDPKTKKIYGKKRQVHLAGGRQAGHAPPPPPRVLRHEAVGLLHPDQPSPATRKQLAKLYVKSGREVRPVVEAILAHPDLYDAGRRMVKPPVVQCAGMLRAVGRGIDTAAWVWTCEAAGQYLFLPPNVSGWDDTRWLDTATFRARWQMSAVHLRAGPAGSRQRHRPADPAELVDAGRRVLGAQLSAAGPRRARAVRRRHARHRRRERGSRRPIPCSP